MAEGVFKMANVLVLGAGGMVGHVAAKYLIDKKYNVTSLSNSRRITPDTILLDVRNINELDAFFKSNNSFDLIINCIALLVRQSDENKALAVYLNSYFPHFLEHRFSDTKTKIIHISSDGVFSGLNAPYFENCKTDAVRFYGKTKALGEIDNRKDLTIRVSPIGPDISNDTTSLFNWFMMARGNIQGYSKVFWNGITSIELAEFIEKAYLNDYNGICHIYSKEVISKYILLTKLKKIFNKNDVNITINNKIQTNNTMLAKRYEIKYEPKDYDVLLSDMKNWIRSNINLYPYYKKYL
jgi:dTDP-4-dehydrorhamnose reductase